MNEVWLSKVRAKRERRATVRGGRAVWALRVGGWGRGRAVAATGTALVLAVASVALAGSGPRQTLRAPFTTAKPASSTGLLLNIDYRNPSDPGAKPPAVREVVTTLAPGSRIDTTAPERCGAPDPVLIALGESACPPGSKVGVGRIDFDTGFPGPGRIVRTDVTFLNNTNELIFLVTLRDTGTRVVSRARVEGRRTTATIPVPLPGTPPDGAAVLRVRNVLQAVSRGAGSARRNYITTPASCPPSGFWINRGTFRYRDGVEQTVSSRSPCARAGGVRPPLNGGGTGGNSVNTNVNVSNSSQTSTAR